MNDLTHTQIIPAGTIVKLSGLPFEVTADTEIRGVLGNFDLLYKLAADSSVGKGTADG